MALRRMSRCGTRAYRCPRHQEKQLPLVSRVAAGAKKFPSRGSFFLAVWAKSMISAGAEGRLRPGQGQGRRLQQLKVPQTKRRVLAMAELRPRQLARREQLQPAGAGA